MLEDPDPNVEYIMTEMVGGNGNGTHVLAASDVIDRLQESIEFLAR